jgi:hypothetical protein
MTERVMDRTRRRIPCDLTIRGRRHMGMVLDVSPTGLFIQTNAKTAPGDRMQMELSLPGEQQRLVLEIEVARRKAVPAQLLAAAKGGIGVRIVDAPESYYRFLSDVSGAIVPVPGAPSREAGAGAGAGPEGSDWSVRVSQTSGPRSRRILVRCGSEEEARRRALDEVGTGWKVLQVEPA